MEVTVINENTIVVEIDQGKAGRGISTIIYQPAQGGYYLLVEYTDGTSELVGLISSTSPASDLIGGVAGDVPYQSAPNTTEFLSIGTPGQVLVAGATLPEYTSDLTNIGSIDFDQAAGVAVGPGQMAWNAADGTLDIGMGYDAVVQQVGLETYYRIKASSAITDGQLVMFTGAVGASGVITGAPTAAGLTEGLRVIGIATMDIPNSDFGYVTNFGLVRGINTTGASVGETWVDGDILYYNPAVVGGMTKVRPTSPNEVVVVAVVTNAGSGGSGSLFVRVSFYPKLTELSDVFAVSPANNDLIQWNATNNRWQKSTNVTIDGTFTAANDAVVGNDLTVGGTLVLTGGLTLNGNVTVGDSASDTLTINSTITSNLIFTDNTYDIGASGATRPRNLYLAGNAVVGGNTTLGDASTDTVQVNGYMGVGGAPLSSAAIKLTSNGLLSGATQRAAYTDFVGSSGATTRIMGFESTVGTAAAAYTANEVIQFRALDAQKGAGSTITNLHGVYVADQTQGTNNYGITSLVSSGANKWNIYASGTANNYFAGNVGVGTNAPSRRLDVRTGVFNSAIAQFTGASDGRGLLISTFSRASNDDSIDYDVPYAGLGVQTWSIAGAEKMRLDSTGNVGIGTSAPNAKLQVTNGTAGRTSYSSDGDDIVIDSTGSGSGLTIASDRASYGVIYFADQDSGTRGIVKYNHVDNSLRLGTGGAEHLFIDSSGNVGIGTSAPSAKLEVAGAVGNFKTTGHQIFLTRNGNNEIYTVGASSVLALGTNSAERLRIDSAGNVGIGTSSPLGKLHVETQPSGGGITPSINGDELVLENNSNCGLTIGTENLGSIFFGKAADSDIGGIGYAMTENSMRFTTNAAERMRIDSAGNVGIGTSSPANPLHVVGTSAAQFQRTSAGTLSVLLTPTGANTQWSVGAHSDGYFRITNEGVSERLRIDSSGNTLIGTTTNTNSSKLVVDGTISETVGGTQYLVASQADIGTAPNEIPLNGYLGSLAYQDTAPVAAPASATAAGLPGQIAYDSSYFYVCTALNTWKRVAISTW